MSLISPITLGTVQFGLDYGINNKIGRIPDSEAQEILSYCVLNGITSFDTASDYGNSEIIIGEFAKTHPDIFITSKLPNISKSYNISENLEKKIINSIKKSARNLNVSQIDNYMVHNFQDLINFKKLPLILHRLKKEGMLGKIGVSVYTPEEAQYVIALNIFDSIQVPINIYDQRFVTSGILTKLKAEGFTIFGRSVFLQGLLFVDSDDIKIKNSEEAKEKNLILKKLSVQKNTSILKLALDFVKGIKEIDSILIGVDSLLQLKNNIQEYNKDPVRIDYSLLSILNPNIIDPRKWVKEL